MTAAISHRLDGLEPDNLLAFLALLGLLRAIEAADREHDRELRPRAGWDIERPPLRPRLFLAKEISQEEICETAASGIATLAQAYDFGNRADLNYSRDEARSELMSAARASEVGNRDQADILAALMTDAAIKAEKDETIDPTPLCLLFGQGHQHFLERLAGVPKLQAPPKRGKGKKADVPTEARSLAEALFHPWHRTDPTPSFRWDPKEDVRYALMAGDPTDAAYKGGTQHGANRLAAIGLAALTVVPERRFDRVRPSMIGGAFDRHGFSFAWPIWEEPASLATIRALLAHPDLRKPGALRHLGVHYVMHARRVSVGKFMNFTRATPVLEAAAMRGEERLTA
ncbi:MAG: hypothetical protein WBE98_15440 [Gammaproteobacteria bacterium]